MDDPPETLAEFFADVGWPADPEKARGEISELSFYPLRRLQGVLFATLAEGLFEPDVVVIYGNTAQVVRLVQAWSFTTGEPVKASFIGRGPAATT